MTKRYALESRSTQTLPKSYTDSLTTSGSPQEEFLKHLDRLGIEWHISEEGTLWFRYWQIDAKDFVPVERVAQLRKGEKDFREVDMMDWISRHLPELEKQYAGKWIAVFDCEVIAASTSISEVLEEVRALGIENPFVTQIPAQPTVWTTAYAQQGI